jgi:hypothetical protein
MHTDEDRGGWVSTAIEKSILRDAMKAATEVSPAAPSQSAFSESVFICIHLWFNLASYVREAASDPRASAV